VAPERRLLTFIPPLPGTLCQAPEDYVLLQVAKSESVTPAGERREQWTASAARSGVRIWDHDVLPQRGVNSELRALEWLALAPAVHAPITAAAVDAMQQRSGGETAC